jgi:hypothetical protein
VNDVWSYTGMPYFDQAEADFGSYRFVMGPSLGDILAVQNLYGANQIINLNAEAFFHWRPDEQYRDCARRGH